MPLNVVGTIAIVLGGMIICDNILTNKCGSGSMETWFTWNGNGAGSNLTIDFVPDAGVVD